MTPMTPYADVVPSSLRFSDIPPTVDIPILGVGEGGEVEVDLEGALMDDPTELIMLLENEGAPKALWMTISAAYAKQGKTDNAIELLTKGLGALARGEAKEKLPLLTCLCWLYLWKSREAPRTVPEGTLVSEAKTKDYYLQASTATLNEASRINPAFPPLYLARGVLYLLRSSLQPPSKSTGEGSPDQSERVETLRQAIKCFEDALRVSGGKNMMALLGKARANFSLGKYAEALEGYQEVLNGRPDLIDPDPRIGIGCCFWMLGFKDDAKIAWERALELNSESKVANVLLALYYLGASSSLPTNDPNFAQLYKKAINEYTQRAFKLDKGFPLTCTTFAGYFFTHRNMNHVENLARKSIEYTDVNAIASDGWYLLARKSHYDNNYERSSEYYRRADEARGGMDKGYLPAKFGIAQLQVLAGDLDGAKFRLEKIIQQSKTLEAMTLLATLYAEDVFKNQAAGFKEDKSNEAKKAIGLFEAVRLAWKDPKKNMKPDSAVLLNLARLYETDHPEKSLQLLQQVEQMEIDMLPESVRPARVKPEDGEEDKDKTAEEEAALTAMIRENLPPQLLNNIGCFQYQAEKYDLAREMFQTALNACIKTEPKTEKADVDALVTTISFNLARTHEAAGLLDEAKNVYEGLLKLHEDYTDALTRLAYISLRQSPNGDGPKAVTKLYQSDSTNLEVRALYGWYLGKSKKRAANIAEDPEQRHYKHTLQHHEKHDRYSLTGMGNLYLMTAREMRRETDSDKEKRRKTYEKAVEFFDKAVQLDPKNAYAAQGIAIALIEDRRDFAGAVQIFMKVRETIRDASVYINLGHAYAELRQYSRAIENYEAALAKDRANDPQILACLGRVWLLKGKQEKNISSMKNALEYSQRALEIAPEQIHFKFNVAFVQFQIALLIISLNEGSRTLVDLEAAAVGLDEAIESFTEIAHSKNPPYPKNDIESRANMGRNTTRRQIERAVQTQRDYEEKNAAKLQEARMLREEDMRQKEEARRRAEEAAREEQRRIAEERQKILERDRALAERRAEDERKLEEANFTSDGEGGKKKRLKRATGGKRKKKAEEGDSESEGEGGKSRGRSGTSASAPQTEDEGRPQRTKRRKLEKRGNAGSNRFKSSEIVHESDDEDDEGNDADNDDRMQVDGDEGGAANTATAGVSDEDEEAAHAVGRRSRKKMARRVGSDSEDEGGDEDEQEVSAARRRSEEDANAADGEEEEEEEEDVAGTNIAMATPRDRNEEDSPMEDGGDEGE
ncbi:hypothetical protein GP486_004639 [Trichoglossum hirsutum]|uniref:Uncharacterized protein n=1 Tax=Trichoglossum hirsutum TaxID=265104 RepID=A0A9P8LAT0_9PEZI|nr:hypothetical protein GP486_004639 [Trichoglossum hirsutum]